MLLSLVVGLRHNHLSWQENLADMASLLRDSPTWEQAVALPEIGVVTPWDLERSWPSDALRWPTYTESTPELAERNFLRPLRRLVAELLGAEAQNALSRRAKVQDLIGRWLMARVQQAISEVTRALDAGEPRLAAGELDGLVRELSHWKATYGTECARNALGSMSRLLAPFAPHLEKREN